jgi:hypothetical protein
MSKLPTLALAGALAAAILAAPGSGQAPTADAFVGSWTYADQPSDVIERAIERGIDDMNFITKPIARRRLRATNNPYSTVEIRHAEGRITTVLEGRAISSPEDGSTIDWRREDGEMLRVATSIRNGTLVQSFTAEDGSREAVYSVSPDGRRLTMQVTIRSDRLPAPIVYRLLYDRA